MFFCFAGVAQSEELLVPESDPRRPQFSTGVQTHVCLVSRAKVDSFSDIFLEEKSSAVICISTPFLLPFNLFRFFQFLSVSAEKSFDFCQVFQFLFHDMFFTRIFFRNEKQDFEDLNKTFSENHNSSGTRELLEKEGTAKTADLDNGRVTGPGMRYRRTKSDMVGHFFRIFFFLTTAFLFMICFVSDYFSFDVLE